MARITKISYTHKPTNNSVYQFFIYSEGFDPKKETLVFKISYNFYYPVYNPETKRHYLEVTKNDFEFEQGKTSSDRMIRLFCYDFQKDANNYIATGSIKIYKSTASSSVSYWGYCELVKAAITSDRPWVDGLKVLEVWGPYQDNQIVAKIDLSKKVRYAAITNKSNLTQAQLLGVKWSCSINGGEKISLPSKIEWSRDEDKNRAIMEFDPPENWDGKIIKVYAFYRGESEEVSQKGTGFGTPVVKSTSPANNVKSTDGNPQLIWGNRVSLEFEQKVLKICEDIYKGKDKYEMANGLMAVMKVETWGSFKAQHLEGESKSRDVNTLTIESFYKKGNPKSSKAVGLIQFTQDALEALGDFPKATNKNKGTQERYDALNKKKLEYAKMGEIKQLDKVRDYLALSAKRAKSPSDIYLQVFAPIGLEKEGNPVLYKPGSDYYTSNQSMDTNTKDGGITKNELLARYWKSYEEGLKNKKGKGASSPAQNTQQGNQNDSDTEGTFKAKNILTYHIYHDGRIEKHIPKNIPDENKNKYSYIYHDSKDVSHEICTVNSLFADKRENGSKYMPRKNKDEPRKRITSIPLGHLNTYDYPKGGDAKKAYIYSNGEIYVEGTAKYGIRRYPKSQGKVELIRMKDFLNYDKDGTKIFYTFLSSQRRYCNPESYAGFIGALATLNRKDVLCTGMCFGDATSYPSVTHPNGDSADTGYFSTLEQEQKKVDAFIKFHFKHIYRGKTGWYPQLKGTLYEDDHETHLHAGDFDSSVVFIIKEK